MKRKKANPGTQVPGFNRIPFLSLRIRAGAKNEIKYGMKLPPEEGTLGFLDMLIHDCRQYLMIATGDLKSIEEEGELALDDPTEDLDKITIRLKRLKDQCMHMAGRRPLDWQRQL